MNIRLGVIVLLIGASVAVVCTDQANVMGPQRHPLTVPAFDGTGWLGSGNRTPDDSIATSRGDGSTNTASEAASAAGWVGSGN